MMPTMTDAELGRIAWEETKTLCGTPCEPLTWAMQSQTVKEQSIAAARAVRDAVLPRGMVRIERETAVIARSALIDMAFQFDGDYAIARDALTAALGEDGGDGA